MIRDGLFEGLDAALLYHPCDRSHVEIAPLASEDVHVTFTGLAVPRGVGALERAQRPRRDDRAVRLASACGASSCRPTRRVHGIIQEGGTAANIIPDRTRAWFMLRSADQAYYEIMKRRFIAMCEAAASASDVEVEVEFSGGATTMNHNVALARALGRERRGRTASSTRAWTRPRDRRTWPTCRGSCPRSTRTSRSRTGPPPATTIEFRDAAARPTRRRTTLLAATLVAQTAIDLLRDPALVEAGVGRVQGRRRAG